MFVRVRDGECNLFWQIHPKRETLRKTKGETSHFRHDPRPFADSNDSLHSKIQANGAVHSILTVQACAIHVSLKAWPND